MTRPNRVAAWQVALVVALLGAACTEDEPPPPDPDRSTAAPIVIEAKALWQGSTGRRQTPPKVEIRGDSVLIFGNTADELNRQLLVADADTGDPRWRIDQLMNLPGRTDRRLGFTPRNLTIVGTATDWSVFVPYLTNDDQPGIARLAGGDGTVLADFPVRVEAPQTPTTHEVVAANDQFVVSGGRTVTGPRRTQVAATDAATGRRLWETTGIWPQFVVGDTLVAQAGREVGAAPEDPDPFADSTVIGLDVTTGKRRWDLATRYPTLKVFAVLGAVAIASQQSSRPDRTARFVIDVHSGETIAELGDGGACVSDQRRLISCTTDRSDELVVFDVADRTTTRVTVPDARQLRAAWHGYLLFGDNRVVDGTGRLVTDDLPGSVIAMSEDHVVLYGATGNDYAVHRRLPGPTESSRPPR
ncbi:outer membrane protein assembly factor BamB family protein [Actinophytocola sediminis]